jgi:hypothetical protein
VFDDFRRRLDERSRADRRYRSRNSGAFAVKVAVSSGLTGGFMFHNVVAGIVGGVAFGLCAWLYWRPGNAGFRHGADRETFDD